MFSAVYAGGIRGMEAYPVRVEIDMSRGLPCFEVVGSVGGEVKDITTGRLIQIRDCKTS